MRCGSYGSVPAAGCHSFTSTEVQQKREMKEKSGSDAAKLADAIIKSGGLLKQTMCEQEENVFISSQ